MFKHLGMILTIIGLFVALNTVFNKAPKLIDQSEHEGDGAWYLYECIDGQQVKIVYRQKTHQYVTEDGFASSKRKAAMKACE